MRIKMRNLDDMKRFIFFAVLLCLSFECQAFDQEPAAAVTMSPTIMAPLGYPQTLPKTADEVDGFKKKNRQPTDSERQQAINKVLLASQQLMNQKKYDEALAKLKEADAIPDKTSEEKLVVEQARIAIAASSRNDMLLTSFIDAALPSDKLQKETKLQYYEVLADINYRSKKFAEAIAWASKYFQEGGKDSIVRDILSRAYYFSGDYAKAEQRARATIQEVEANGQKPDEMQLRLLASCEIKTDDHAGYIDAIEKYVTYYPRKEYWTDLLNNILSKPSFPEYLSLDLYRLMQATGQLTTPKDYVEMAQLALASGYPAEAKKVLDEGFQSKILGVGGDAAKQKQLYASVVKIAELDARLLSKKQQGAGKDRRGDALIDDGFSYAQHGQFDKGIPLMEEGIRIGGLKRPDESKLHLGLAYMMANQKDKAIEMFKKLQGSSSVADIAKYWILFLNSPHQLMS